jgi:hypothetical protein
MVCLFCLRISKKVIQQIKKEMELHNVEVKLFYKYL